MKEDAISFSKLVSLLKLERSEITAIYFYAILGGLIQLSLPLGIQAVSYTHLDVYKRQLHCKITEPF